MNELNQTAQSMVAPTLRAAVPRFRALARRGFRLLSAGWHLAKAHELNPWVFVVMSAIGWAVQGMVYLPWFQGDAWRLTLLILLRIIALVVPTYILLKGKRIALAFNTSLVVMFTANTTWHVCYYVFL